MPHKSPPRARLAFRVGVVGHRPNRLQNADVTQLGKLLYEVLHTVQVEIDEFAASSSGAKLYSGEEPILRAITPLAEGTDRIFAVQALAPELKYELCCPMPFHQEKYEQDFLPQNALEANSLDRFRTILAKAKTKRGLVIFELDGDRSDSADAYGAAGRVVLSQSDLLVTVWDGGEPAGGGGTVDTLRDAIHYGVPVLLIGAIKPHGWLMIRSELDLDCLKTLDFSDLQPPQSALSATLAPVVREEIALPRTPPREPHENASDDTVNPDEYFAERRPRLHLFILWTLFRDLVGSGSLRWPKFKVEDYETEIGRKWATDAGTDTSRWVDQRLLSYYAWPDKLADRYADAYRSTYIFIYLAAAFAVFLALLPMAAGWEEGKDAGQAFCVASEFAILLVIIGLLLWEKGRHWHRRWLAYRLLAELIRHLRCLLPLGGGPPLPRVPQHLAIFGDPGPTWMYWQLRAIARATGIPAATITKQYLDDCLHYLNRLVRGSDGQIGFHDQNYERSKQLNHRLHKAALWMFGLTLGCIIIHLFPPVFSRLGISLWPHEQIDRWLTLACATLPAFGAAMGGISNQGEFARIAKRSRSMTNLLEQFSHKIDSLLTQNASGELRLAQVVELAGSVMQLMVDEVVEWRVIFVDRPPPAA